MIFAVVVLTLSVNMGHAQNSSWCAVNLSCVADLNSLCIYKPEVNKSSCTLMVEELENKPELQAYWLALHNTFRDKVAAGKLSPWPSAADMRQLRWDSTLELQARIFDFQCMDTADPCNRHPTYVLNIGQIHITEQLLNSLRKTSDLKAFLKAFFISFVAMYKDVQDVQKLVKNGYELSSIDRRLYGMRYFFSVLTYANSNELGGSVIRYSDVHFGKTGRSVTYTAEWYLEKRLYTEGSPCSKCPSGYSCNKKSTYKHLCVQPGYPMDGEYVEGLPESLGTTLKQEIVLLCGLLLLTKCLIRDG